MSAGQPPIDSPQIRRLSPVLGPGHTFTSVTDKISSIVLTRPTSLGWVAGFAISFSLVMILTVALAWLIIKGVGIWGINIPIGWGFAIVNFVWCIGIGHAGTLISAILFLLNQKWRTSINRFAEPMKIIYGMLSMGWRGSARHWHRYQSAYLLLAGLATPLVLSVHTVVSFDFAIAIVPGWHTTIFPPYFVAGALYSGFAMVLTIAIPLRKAYGLEDFITMRHLENMAMVMLATGLIVAYGYFFEYFMSIYSGNKFDLYLTQMRFHGPYSHFYYALILCNILTPQLLWFHKARTNIPLLFVMSLVVNLGMWLERFVIVVISLTRDFMPSAWGRYSATFWAYATFAGTIGLFVMLLFLFVRVMPAISIAEMRELVAETSEDHE